MRYSKGQTLADKNGVTYVILDLIPHNHKHRYAFLMGVSHNKCRSFVTWRDVDRGNQVTIRTDLLRKYGYKII